MGTHPIFESDFDCLTDCSDWVNNTHLYLNNFEYFVKKFVKH